ncbi:MAG: hypothetical protein ACJATI_004676 [Halioglobus sp.]|jgi:hypothetical protein
MFVRSENSQGDLFRGIGSHLSKRKSTLLNESSGWHNVF